MFFINNINPVWKKAGMLVKNGTFETNCLSKKHIQSQLKASFWGLLGLIHGNLTFQELKFFKTNFFN